MDMETAEYDVVPHLLATGALCHVKFLLIEWHNIKALVARNMARYHAAKKLRSSFLTRLRGRCPNPPAVDEYSDKEGV